MVLNNARVFCALMCREFKILHRRLSSALIDSFALLLLNVGLAGYLLPAMGMPHELILPLYLGYMLLMIMETNSGTAFTMVLDIHNKGLITYYITLPLPKRWLIAVYLTKEIIKTALQTLPLLLIGWFILGLRVPTPSITLGACMMYALILLFISTFFLTLAFWYPKDWYIVNVWPRRINPLVSTGCLLFTWRSISTFSPTISKLLLLNPFTYISEGFRAAVLGQNQFLPLIPTIIIIISSIMCMLALLSIGLKRRLDAV